MVALRRSARLTAAPEALSAQSNIQQPKSTKTHHNGVNKPRKNPASKSKKPQSTQDRVSPAEALQTTEPTSTPQLAVPNIFDSLPTNNTSTNRTQTTPPPLNRPVEPHRTNATLLTPHGSSLVAYPSEPQDASPGKTGRPPPTATTGTLLEKAVAHLIAIEPRLQPVIEKHPCHLFSPEGLAEEIDPFRSLVNSIIGQQVSGAAAKSIRDRFVVLFENIKNGFPTPEEILRKDIPTLRTAGLSQRKAEYIQGLAEKFASGELSARMLLNASDKELVERLTAVRGLGLWSVEMFACFALKRIDVFSTGDLGVQYV